MTCYANDPAQYFLCYCFLSKRHENEGDFYMQRAIIMVVPFARFGVTIFFESGFNGIYHGKYCVRLILYVVIMVAT